MNDVAKPSLPRPHRSFSRSGMNTSTLQAHAMTVESEADVLAGLLARVEGAQGPDARLGLDVEEVSKAALAMMDAQPWRTVALLYAEALLRALNTTGNVR